MFLSDQLYEIIKEGEKTVITPKDVQATFNKLLEACTDYYIKLCPVGTSYNQFRIIIKRTWNHWDLFARKLKKENHPFSEICKEGEFKRIFLSDPKRVELFNKQ